MDDNYNALNKLFDNTPRICPHCNGAYEYLGAGEYKCKNCKDIAYDDYGKVRKFIDEHGPAPYHVVKKATGVNGNLVREYLESPTSERSFDRKCLRCGCRIQAGRLCSTCQMAESRPKEESKSTPISSPKAKKSLRGGDGGVHFVADRHK